MKKKERRSVREGSIFSKKFPGDIDFIDKEFKQNPHKWRKTGFPNDFPVLLDPKIQRSYLKRFGEPFGDEIQYKLYWNEEEKKLAGGVYFSRRCEGPPNKVHGGAQGLCDTISTISHHHHDAPVCTGQFNLTPIFSNCS